MTSDRNGSIGRQPGEERTAAEIVVGLDGSPSAAAALRWAAGQSRVTGSPLRVLYAWQIAPLGVSGRSADFPEAAGADARARATRWVLDTLGEAAAEIRWRLEIVSGPPGPALVSRSRGAQLLVLGTREHTGLRRAVHGSVSHYCMSHADAPVVAVPAGAPARPAGAPDLGGLISPGPLL